MPHSTHSDRVATRQRRAAIAMTVVAVISIVALVITLVMPKPDTKFSAWSLWGGCVDGKESRTRNTDGVGSTNVYATDLVDTQPCAPPVTTPWTYGECKDGKITAVRALLQEGKGTTYANDSPDLTAVFDCPNQTYLSNTQAKISPDTVRLYDGVNFENSSTAGEYDEANSMDARVLIDHTGKFLIGSLKIPKGTVCEFFRNLNELTKATVDSSGVEFYPADTGTLDLFSNGNFINNQTSSDFKKVFEHRFEEDVPDLCQYLLSVPEIADLRAANRLLVGDTRLEQTDPTSLEIAEAVLFAAENADSTSFTAGTTTALEAGTYVQPVFVRFRIPSPAVAYKHTRLLPIIHTMGYISEDIGAKNLASFPATELKSRDTFEEFKEQVIDEVTTSYVAGSNSLLYVPSSESKVLCVQDGNVVASYAELMVRTIIHIHRFDHFSLEWQEEVVTASPGKNVDIANLALRTLQQLGHTCADCDILLSFQV